MDPLSTDRIAERDVTPLLQELGLSAEPLTGPGEPTAAAPPAELLRVAEQLRARGFMLLDCVGVDYLKYPQPRPQRFAVLYNFYQPYDHRRLFVRVWLADGQAVESLSALWRSARYLEREVYDLIGVEFSGHPDLRKILTPDDLEGHPLRKDFPIGETPTLFREGRFLDPAAFRAGLSGQDAGLTGWRGNLRRGGAHELLPPVLPAETAPKGGAK